MLELQRVQEHVAVIQHQQITWSEIVTDCVNHSVLNLYSRAVKHSHPSTITSLTAELNGIIRHDRRVKLKVKLFRLHGESIASIFNFVLWRNCENELR